ncbi:MAG: hypothetical protein AAFQ07_12080 [Chloroflexota bacterium]
MFLPTNDMGDITQPPELIAKTAVANVLSKVREAVRQEAEELAAEWGEANAMQVNIFMQDRCEELVVQMLSGYFTRMQPRAGQLSDMHIDTYLGINNQPNTPDPVK